MHKFRVAICDDEILLLPQLSSMVKSFFRSQNFETEPDTFASAQELLHSLYHVAPHDIYFLDIDIPELDGISLAEKIKDCNPDAHILFVSAREERVFDTFRIHPLAFVRKSNFSEDMKKAMKTLMEHLEKPADQMLNFQDELGHILSLNLTRLMYIEANEKYQNLVSTDGSNLIRCSISDLEKALVPHQFIRIHRGYLVNPQYIYRIDTSSIILDGSQNLPLSRHRKKEVQNLFLAYNKTS